MGEGRISAVFDDGFDHAVDSSGAHARRWVLAVGLTHPDLLAYRGAHFACISEQKTDYESWSDARQRRFAAAYARHPPPILDADDPTRFMKESQTGSRVDAASREREVCHRVAKL